jgi:hypothetical protein
MAQSAKTKSRIASHPWTSAAIAVLVLADIWFTLYVPLYARTTPKVGDFPFFYFYLLIYFPATAIVLWIVVLLQRSLGPTADGAAGRATGSSSPSEVAQ